MITIDTIIENQLCTGCGACISEDTSKTSFMHWDEYGFLIPKITPESSQDLMIDVCPFKPGQLNEDEISETFIKSPLTTFNPEIGYYQKLYVGFSRDYRKTSSSGGIATFVFGQLLHRDIAQHLFVVMENNGSYAYKLISNISELKLISKTRYTPVTLEDLFIMIDSIDGKVAVSGTACFVKAIRLKQIKKPHLKKKISFIVGIICGGLKSKYYTDYLAQSAGCSDEYQNAQYRVKNESSTATDYKFACTNSTTNKIHMVDMQKLGDMWGTGLFKSNACDFCDDVLTELADISLGDAWIHPYISDGLGNNIVITRSSLSEKIIADGIVDQKLNLEILPTSEVILSQRGSFNHRHKGLKYRIDYMRNKGMLVPNKRKRFLEKQNFIFNRVQYLRLQTRKDSLSVWLKYRNAIAFNTEMHHRLKKLKKLSKLNQKIQLLKSGNIWIIIKNKLKNNK